MLVKFETKSQRVKGLSFHPTRPWILSSLHSGEIQLWDYRIGTLIDKFEEHEGPVRGINFHPNQPLFVSGGDDYKIVGWNYKTKRKMFLLKGHLDYIRTVSFHHELPWVLSTSDDQTIRIWNYLSRSQLTILTGHSHYVMCAQFHPNKDLIVSCSLDQTLRLWDYTNLRKKYTSTAGKSKPQEGGYTGNEVEVKAIMDGHERGVNWCAFHPSSNLIVSAADDRKVKLWKYNESTGKAWEHDSLYGHTNNVSSVVFHDKLDCIISNAEDKTIKVWDLNRRICIDTFRKDTDRYWMLAIHPELNYIAAGSDSGLTVFTLQSEKIPAVVSSNQQDIFYVHKKQLIHRDIKTGRESIIKAIDHTPSHQSLQYQKPTSIFYNHFNNSSHNILIQYKDKEKIYYKYFLFSFENNIERAKNNANSTNRYCITAVFIGKDKVAVLSTTKELGLLEPGGSVKTIPNLPPIDMIYPGPLGKVIIRSETVAMLYDITTRKIINQIDMGEVARLKRVTWSNNFNYVALTCKKSVLILNKSFVLLGTIQEKFNVTSAVWNYDNVLIYTTANHMKYSILNGDHGILKCLETPFYLIYAKENEAITVDRDAKIQSVMFDREEYLFKVALFNKDAKRIKFLMDNHKKLGNSIIAYLYKKNYSGVALNMVQHDTRARFSLAIDSGNLEVAYKTCHEELKDKECYAKLGEEALRQGNHQIVEVSYQKTKAYDKLAFLYMLTGNSARLEKMLNFAQNKNDVMSRFQIALYLGDIHERIRILAEVGLLHLAYHAAVHHNIPEMAEPLYNSLQENIPEVKLAESPQALIPLKPLISNPSQSPIAFCNWPHHQLLEEDILLLQSAQDAEAEVVEAPKDTQQLEFEPTVDTTPSYDEKPQKEDKPVANFNLGDDLDLGADTGAWGGDDDLDIPDVPVVTTTVQAESNIADSTPGKDIVLEKTRSSQFAGELAAIGDFDGAAALLKKQIGVTKIEPFAPIFQKINQSSKVRISGLPFVPPQKLFISDDQHKPVVLGSIGQLSGLLKQAYKLFGEGKFQNTLDAFREILYQIPLLVLKSKDNESDIYSLIRICYNYIFATRCELAKKSSTDPLKVLELASYMAVCALQPAHRVLVLKITMTLAFKGENFIYAAFFAKKILAIKDAFPNACDPKTHENAKKVYDACQVKGSNKDKIEFEESWLYDDDAITKFCAKSFKSLKGKDVKKDAFVQASYSAEFDGQVDEIAGVCKIGAECLGLKIY